ncbi:hypothetical protein DFJ74DRAFT_694451 [Hyaloraphidium curvatum]|nr:hypothetical protein DFJ74DRAFT_694451 [Hyaloraphidium curvatum]
MPPPLRIGIAGLGAVGFPVALRLLAAPGIPGLSLAAIASRNPGSSLARLADRGASVEGVKSVPVAELADHADVVVECLPPGMFAEAARACLERGKTFVPLSVGQLLSHPDLVDLAASRRARIVVPTGALLALDAVRAAAQGTIRSVRMVTRKPPAGLAGAPYLVERGIDLAGLAEPRKVFDGTAREGARGFPANVNIAAALSLAGIGPDRTMLEIWADPTIARNTHKVTVESDAAKFEVSIESVPSPENPRTGLLTPLSVIACLKGMVDTLRVGT